MDTATISIQLHDGARSRLTGTPEVLVTIHDNANRNRFSQYVRAGSIRVADLEVHDDGTDHCAVIVALRGCSDGAFFPVTLAANQESHVDLMLPPRKIRFDLDGAAWAQLQAQRPRTFAFLAGVDPDQNGQAYEDLRLKSPMKVACLHNIVTAIDLLPDQNEGEVLGFFKRITIVPSTGTDKPSEGLRQDRFFAWAEPALQDHLEGRPEMFTVVSAALHAGADLSFKETRLGEANLQFTFHDEKPPDGTNWKKVEMDMDYFHDPLSHFTLEVIPNEVITRGGKFLNLGKPHLTNPAEIYSLRWMAGKHKGDADFAPPFTLVAA